MATFSGVIHGTVITVEQAYLQETYTAQGFNFDNVWIPVNGSSFPTLLQPPLSTFNGSIRGTKVPISDATNQATYESVGWVFGEGAWQIASGSYPYYGNTPVIAPSSGGGIGEVIRSLVRPSKQTHIMIGIGIH